MTIERIHHVAYRCRDAQQTVLWYQKYLDMNFVLAIAENEVPSTGEPDPYMHVFLDAGQGNILAFFELPSREPMDRDRNTPDWVQHIAFKMPDRQSMQIVRERLEADGIEVVGPTDHTLFESIYFFDPNGHRIELAVDTHQPGMLDRLSEVKWAMLDEWALTRRAPAHARWLHEKSGAAE